MCLEKLRIIVSKSIVERALKHSHYTVKRVTRVPERRNTDETKQKRYEYAIQYTQMMSQREKIFFLDETEIPIWSRATYGRFAEGVRAIKRTKSLRSLNSFCYK